MHLYVEFKDIQKYIYIHIHMYVYIYIQIYTCLMMYLRYIRYIKSQFSKNLEVTNNNNGRNILHFCSDLPGQILGVSKMILTNVQQFLIILRDALESPKSCRCRLYTFFFNMLQSM